MVVFCKKGVLKTFANFTENHLCWSLFLIKLQDLRTVTLLKRDSNTGVSYEICELFKNTYFEKHLRTTAFSSSSFKLDLVDFTVFPDSNLRLVKINKLLPIVCVSKFSRFCSHRSSFLCYQIQKLQNFIFFIHFQ